MITSLIPSFNGGELSPLVHLRSDLETYRSGCKTLKNMLITPFGGVRRRPGFEFIASHQQAVRPFSFQYSTDVAYVLAFEDVKLSFYTNGTSVKIGNLPYSIPSPYSASQLANLTLCQINNVAYLSHSDYPLHKLTRFGNASWSLEPVVMDYPPMRSENLQRSNSLLVASSSEKDGFPVPIISVANKFRAGHVGAYFEIKMERGLLDFEVSLAAAAINDDKFSDPLSIQGGWSFTTQGTWSGEYRIQRSQNGGVSWKTIRLFKSTADANYSANGTEPSLVLLRIAYNHVANGSSNPKASLVAEGAFIKSLVRCLTVYNESQALFHPVTAVLQGQTSYWSEGAWSTHRGFPRTVTAHEQRLVLGGNKSESQTVWASSVDDYENFERGVKDSDAWVHSLVADQQDSIQWMLSNKTLIIGTSGGEWVIQAGKDDGIITPTSVRARRHSGHGSRTLPAILAGSATLFVQRGGRKLREMSFSFQDDGYVTQDLTLLAEHIAGEGGITQTALQEQRDTIIWCVTADGGLIGLTYERSQKIAGWANMRTGKGTDAFLGVAVIATNGDEDEVWVSVRRIINGETKYFMERMRPDQFREQQAGRLNNLFFVDSGIQRTLVGMTEVSGLGHLEGETVQVLADGGVLAERTVNAGKITLNPVIYTGDPETASTIVVGLPYVSILEPTNLEMGMRNGTSVSRNKQIHEVVIYFHQSSGCKISSRMDKPFDTISFRNADGVPDAGVSLFTGPIIHALDSRSQTDVSLVLMQDQPLPLTVSGIVPKWNVYGDS